MLTYTQKIGSCGHCTSHLVALVLYIAVFNTVAASTCKYVVGADLCVTFWRCRNIVCTINVYRLLLSSVIVKGLLPCHVHAQHYRTMTTELCEVTGEHIVSHGIVCSLTIDKQASNQACIDPPSSQMFPLPAITWYCMAILVSLQAHMASSYRI
jgi:hypothetical protein